MTPIRFDGQVAVVTGAGGGLGRVYALELAGRGAGVVVNDLGGARDGSGSGSFAADAVVEEIRGLGGEASASYDSVTTPGGGKAIIDTALSRFGRVDILINNAGILRDKSFAKMEPDGWTAVVDVHLNGAYNVTRPAVVAMRAAGYGRVVFATSAAGLYGNFGQTNYSAAKLGLVGLMNSLRLENDKYNIKFNCVAPIAATRMTEGILPSQLMDKLKPEYAAPLVAYLCSSACAENGMIFNAGPGVYNRAAIVTGREIAVIGKEEIPSAEEVAAQMACIASLEGAREFPSATAAYLPMFQAFSLAEKERKKKP